MKTQIIIKPQLNADGFFLDQVETDMLLLTRLENLALGPGPQAVDNALEGLISRKMSSKKFSGALGQHLLFDLDPRKFGERPQRFILLVGVGSPRKFCGRAACQIFRLVVDKALETGVEEVTIPFAPNRITDGALNLKGTAHILNGVLSDNQTRLDSSPLRRVQVLCTPQARKHVEHGLLSKAVRDCCRM